MTESKSRVVDVLVAGGGLAGLLLAREIRRRGLSVLVADDPRGIGAWSAALGLLNPLRGRRYTVAWRAAEAFAAARETYAEVARRAGGPPLVRDVAVIRPFSGAEERDAGLSRIAELERAGFPAAGFEEPPAGIRRTGFGGIRVTGASVVDVPAVIAALRAELSAAGALIPARFPSEDLDPDAGSITWKGARVEAGRLVLAGGAGDIGHPLLRHLQLRPVKGESALVRVPDLAPDFALAGELHLAPRGGDSWLCGGTKAPGETAVRCTDGARIALEAFLRARLDVPWTIVEQRAGIRAVAGDRLPCAGPITGAPGVSVLNGLGSQGVALGPWVAARLAGALAAGEAVPPEILPSRFDPRPAPEARWNAVERAQARAAAHLVPGDRAVDLTAGNGGDAAWLAEKVGPMGRVLAFDIQPEAIAATGRRLAAAGLAGRVDLLEADHGRLADIARDAGVSGVAVVMANLGYLPGSASPLVTRPRTTLAAFDAALRLLSPEGALVAVVYPGHPGGTEERAALERWAAALDPGLFEVTWDLHPGGEPRAPAVLVVRRAGSKD